MKYLSKLSTLIGVSLFLMILLSFFWWQAKFSTKKIIIDLNDNKSNPSLKIEEAKYSGFSQNGQKFSVSAKLITENQSKENVLNLKNPNAIIETRKNEITISANNGEFHVKDKSIFLLDNVSFFDENYTI